MKIIFIITCLMMVSCVNKKESPIPACTGMQIDNIDSIYKKNVPLEDIEARNLSLLNQRLLQLYFFKNLATHTQAAATKQIGPSSEKAILESTALASATSSALAVLGANSLIIKPAAISGNLLTSLSRTAPIYTSALAASSTLGSGSVTLLISDKLKSEDECIANMQAKLQAYNTAYFNMEADKLTAFFLWPLEVRYKLDDVFYTASINALTGKDSIVMNTPNYFYLDKLVQERLVDKTEIDVFKKVLQQIPNAKAEQLHDSKKEALKETIKALQRLNTDLENTLNQQNDGALKEKVSELIASNKRIISLMHLPYKK